MIKGFGFGRDVVLWVICWSGILLIFVWDVIFMLYNGCRFLKKRCV